MDLFRVTLLG
ncbi:unnamed protein product [Arabidopsis thaliana]|uniref:Uncharacterized protein n=2 Tax=Arabidopsis thaliana TaxID=3702 RepID=A0A654EEC6_ARATH|nr:uncharacterized protein AT1G24660 [Arabidopsis thaliana]ANM60430.1 hypothetical protein AT1G24660 [Arabidopsis thaliana]CAA0240751.1 unnamed protein product [Arabidopsis thaliana]VYS47120.1 unnamed protein product [Arabidopsis thaliana]|eukprot:NP_001336512.1 hypothetical protein AT1G24660 [Arabidopsis thaliana]